MQKTPGVYKGGFPGVKIKKQDIKSCQSPVSEKLAGKDKKKKKKKKKKV